MPESLLQQFGSAAASTADAADGAHGDYFAGVMDCTMVCWSARPANFTSFFMAHTECS